MALSPPKTNILSDLLSGGISQDVDRRHRSPFKLTTAENVRLLSPGRYGRRNGLTFVDSNVEGESDLSSLNANRNCELAGLGNQTVLYTTTGTYSYLPSYGKFDKRGSGITHTVDTAGVVVPHRYFAQVDKGVHYVDVAVDTNRQYAGVVSLSVSGLTTATTYNYHRDVEGVMTFSVVDLVSGATVYTAPPFYDVSHCRVVYLATPNVFVVVWRDGVDVLAQSFALSNPATQSSLLTRRTLVTLTDANRPFDAVPCSGEGSYFYLITQDDAGAATWPVSVRRVTAAGSPSGDNFTVSGATLAGSTPNGRKLALSACATKGEQIYILCAQNNGTASLSCYVHTESSMAAVGSASVDTAPTSTAYYLASGICRVSSTRAAFVFTRFERDNTRATALSGADFGPCTFSGFIESNATFATGEPKSRGTPWTTLYSRPFVDPDDSKVYAWFVANGVGKSRGYTAASTWTAAIQDTGTFSSEVPSESLVLCELRYAESLANVGLAADNRAAIPKAVTAAWVIDGEISRQFQQNLHVVPCSVSTAAGFPSISAFGERLSGDTVSVVKLSYLRGPNLFGYTHGAATKAVTTPYGVVSAGGMPSVFDGARSGELGFLSIPTSLTYAAIAAGGTLPLGYYSYKYCFARILRDGSILRSPMSIPTGAVQSTGGNNTVQIHVGVPGLTEWANDIDGEGIPNNTFVEIYRSFGDSALSNEYTLHYRLPIYSAPASMNYPFLDDGTVTSPPQLADPSELTINLCQPPCFTHLCLHKNRIFGIGDGVLWFSNEWTKGEVPGFLITNQVQSSGKPFVACASMETTLVLFTEDKIYILSGEGPDDLGLNNDYSAPQPLPVSFGTRQARSVVEWPGGVAFIHTDGNIYNLNRGLAVDFIGEPIQDETRATSTCIDAAHVGKESSLVFTLYFQTNRRFVFDYKRGSWYEDTFHANVGIPTRTTIINGETRHLTPTGLFKTNDIWHDIDAAGTPRWAVMKLKWGPMCSGGNPEGWQRTRAVSFIGEWRNPAGFNVNLYENFSATAAKSITKAASTLATEVASVQGATFNEEINVKNPENQALEVEIADVAPASTGDYGEGFRVVGLSFDVEPQGGMSRKPSTKKG